MSDTYFRGFWRMDWGLGNPNKTAALITTLMIGVWFLAYFRRWGFWAALVLFTGLGIGLIHTYSRGGVFGAVVGLAIVLFYSPRPWPWSKIFALVVSIWSIAGATFYLEAAHRFGQGITSEDRSITNRLEIWKAAPRMMVDAPAGWGFGQSGAAYMQWYQPVDRTEAYRTLVNSHLTWLVESNWAVRFVYVFAWIAIFMLCSPTHSLRAATISFGIWVALAITATFSSVAEAPIIWITPVLGLFAVLAERLYTCTWPRPRSWLVSFATAGLFVFALFFAGQFSQPGIRKTGEVIVVGQGCPTTYILVDTKVCGRQYGKTLRRFLAAGSSKPPTFEVVETGRMEQNTCHRKVIIAGSIPENERNHLGKIWNEAEQIILLNPTFFPQEVKIPKNVSAKITAFFGEFSQSPSNESWGGRASVVRVNGAGDYLPSWPEIAFQKN